MGCNWTGGERLGWCDDGPGLIGGGEEEEEVGKGRRVAVVGSGSLTAEAAEVREPGGKGSTNFFFLRFLCCACCVRSRSRSGQMEARQYARGTVGRKSGLGSGGAPRGDESREIKSWDSGIRALARGSAAEAVRARRGGVVQRARLGGAGGGAKEKKNWKMRQGRIADGRKGSSGGREGGTAHCCCVCKAFVWRRKLFCSFSFFEEIIIINAVMIRAHAFFSLFCVFFDALSRV